MMLGFVSDGSLKEEEGGLLSGILFFVGRA